VQENLLRTLLTKGDAALHEAIQTAWPLDPEDAFGVLPTRLRMHADPRFSGQGVTIALLDSGFYPHPDLVRPRNRIRAWADATRDPVLVLRFRPEDVPVWPGSGAAADSQWHGTMTSTVAAGNGYLSHGLYAGLAHRADLVLLQVRDSEGHISSASIARALRWLREHGKDLGVRVVNLSVSGDPVSPLAGNPVDTAVEALVEQGMSVVAAAGNDGHRVLLPPATAPFALTIGGLDDTNLFDAEQLSIWHSNYGVGGNGVPKPELVAPSIWVAAPVLPNSSIALIAQNLFARRREGDPRATNRIDELKLITPHYQHAEGTSFAAPIVASAIACLLEANPTLTPLLIRDVLIGTACRVPGADDERQGAGAVNPGVAVARALAERHSASAYPHHSPARSAKGVVFSLHDHAAAKVRVMGSWNGWAEPGEPAKVIEPGFWETAALPLPPGDYAYKFLLDGKRWLDDPANPAKLHDGSGGFNSALKLPAAHAPLR
jgi:serine protease AprX